MNEENELKKIALANSLAVEGRRFILFCGSGVSKDADVPTGWDILLETLKLLRHHKENCKLDYSHKQMELYYNEHYTGMTYSKIIETLYPNNEDQRTFLNSFFTGKKPGLSHKLIAKWVQNGLVRFIVTTNFDMLLENALSESGINYSSITSGYEALNSEPWPHVKYCRIYKIHGSIDKGFIRNTEKDLEFLDDQIGVDFLRIIDTHGVIVLGYSGNDKAVMSIFENRQYKGLGFYWITRNIASTLVDNLVKDQNGKFISITSSHDFLEDILDKTVLTRGKSKQINDLDIEIKRLEEDLDSLYKKQEELFAYDTTQDYINLLACMSGIKERDNKLSQLKKQKADLLT